MATSPGSSGPDLAASSLKIILANQDASGAFLAGPTFGPYRYAWLRDGAFVAEALDLVGELEAGRRFHDWVAGLVLDSAAGIERSIEAAGRGRVPDPDDYLHCRYELDGAPGPDDWPTFQLDGPGIWLWSLAHHARSGGRLTERHRRAAELAARYVAALRNLPSYDAWEESPDHVHSSTRGAILAGLRAAEDVAGQRPSSAEAARHDLEAWLGDGAAGPFTKWDGNDAVDGSLLWFSAPYDLLAPNHPRFAATLDRIERELVSGDGGVHRYRDDTYYGGGEWLLLAAALGRVYLRRGLPGDSARARRALSWIEGQARPDGSLPEQVGARALHAEWIEPWRRRWGESACPLIWSHAAHLALRVELERAGPAEAA